MKRVLSPLVLLLVGIVCFAPAVSADSGYTAIHGGEVSLDEFLVMGRDTPVPDASFRFTVAPGSAMAGTDRTLEVVSGPAGIAFKEGTGVTVNSDGSATVRFSPSDTAVNEASAPAGDGVHFDTTDNEDEKYVKKTLTVDLSGVSFTDVGVYRYVLTEEVPAERTLKRDGNPVRYLDVYVTDNNGSLGIPVVFWHTAAVAPGKTGEDMTYHKSTGMTSRAYRSSALAVEKTVEGNQSSRDQYFAFTVKLTGTSEVPLESDSKFAVSGSYDASPATNMATAYTSAQMQQANDVGGSVTYAELISGEGKTFYLRHGQRIVISGIPEGLGYVVTETEEDYTPSCVVTGDVPDSAQGNTASDAELTEDTAVSFHNLREADIPTGVLLRAGVPVLLGVLGTAGLLAVVILRRRRRCS